MVMIFASEKARTQLLEEGCVYTVRTRPHREGFDWATDKRGSKKICDIHIQLRAQLALCDLENTLPRYLHGSGFASVREWIDEIHGLNKELPPSVRVYRVIKMSSRP